MQRDMLCLCVCNNHPYNQWNAVHSCGHCYHNYKCSLVIVSTLVSCAGSESCRIFPRDLSVPGLWSRSPSKIWMAGAEAKDLASLVVSNEKTFFWFGVRIFCEWCRRWRAIRPPWPTSPSPGPKLLDGSTSLKFLLETRL